MTFTEINKDCVILLSGNNAIDLSFRVMKGNGFRDSFMRIVLIRQAEYFQFEGEPVLPRLVLLHYDAPQDLSDAEFGFCWEEEFYIVQYDFPPPADIRLYHLSEVAPVVYSLYKYSMGPEGLSQDPKLDFTRRADSVDLFLNIRLTEAEQRERENRLRLF